jgi:hypothetical protein
MQAAGAAAGSWLTYATIAAGALSAKSSIDAGKLTSIQYQEQAKQEADASRDREIERRRRLVTALASQNAEAGAGGATIGLGSRSAIALSDARRASYETLADRASTGRRSLLLRLSGKEAKNQGNLNALSTLLGTAADVSK